MILSKRSKYANNPIEEEDKVAEELVRKGAKIIQLNRGDPPVYFPTPRYIIDAYVKALREGKTTYSRAEGLRMLAGAIAKRYKSMYGIEFDEESVIVTQGVSEALSFLNSALINENETAVLFKPYYPLYVPLLMTYGGRAILADYNEEDNWSIDIEGLKRKLTEAHSKGKKIKYLLITNPNNPTGTVLSKKTLQEVADIANDNSLLLISDEIYDEIVYNGAKFTSIGEVAKGQPHVILNGASKDFDSTGFRIGFVAVPEEDKISIELKQKLADYAKMRLSVNLPAQYAVAEAISNAKEHKKAISKMVKEIEKRANYAAKKFSENPLLTVTRPNGAFYLLPKLDMEALKFKNDAEFVDRLLKEEFVQLTRGSGFGAPSHFRIVALPPKDILDYAIDKINDFCAKNSK
ncbi:MAG: aminotransferase class I/II-fold pyridoxal phosphate-dependent enzyme [Candidatus Micrarchaeia archaeon]